MQVQSTYPYRLSFRNVHIRVDEGWEWVYDVMITVSQKLLISRVVLPQLSGMFQEL